MKIAKILLAVLLAAATVFTLVACKANYEWNTEKIPKPSFRNGETGSDDDGYFWATIDCTEKDYQDYINQCWNSGFNAEEYYSSDGSATLFDADGCTLSLSYNSGTSYRSGYMNINLAPPIALVHTEWPNSTASAQLPKPKSDIFGQVRGASGDNNFSIYVGDTPHSDFADYVKQCKEAGFNDITYDEPTDFMASNGEYRIMLTYASLNVMFVNIDKEASMPLD